MGVRKRKALSKVSKKHIKIVGYLILSGGLGYALATYVMGNPALVTVLTPAINYAIYSISLELKKEGYIEGMKR